MQVSSDRAPEIKKALVDLGFASEPSAPYQKIKNALAESTIRTIKGMASSILIHSGLDLQHWPLALKYLEWAYNITAPAKGLEDDEEEDGNPSRYKRAMGYDIECFMVPFAALVWYKNPGPYSFGPKGEPALFLGAELIDGMLFKGNYRVWPMEHFHQGVYKEFVTRTIAIPNGQWQFPASKAAEAPVLDARAEEELEDISYTPSLASEIGDDLGEGEREDLGDPKEGVCPAPGAGDIANRDPGPKQAHNTPPCVCLRENP